MRSCLTLLLSVIMTSLLAAVQAAEQPNILWLTSEDNGISWVGCYGGTNCKTPIAMEPANFSTPSLNATSWG